MGQPCEQCARLAERAARFLRWLGHPALREPGANPLATTHAADQCEAALKDLARELRSFRRSLREEGGGEG